MRPGRARSGLSAVFLDRDGVINRKAPEGEYVTTWESFAFLPGALEALRLLAGAQLPVVVVTNQRGVARRRLTEDVLADIHARMRAAVSASGGRIDAVHHCPHEGGCACRKPEVGMFTQAASELGIALDHSAVVGDSASDMLAGGQIGAVCVLVGEDKLASIAVDHIAVDLLAAVRWLLR